MLPARYDDDDDDTITTTNPRSQCLGQDKKKYFASLIIWRQNQSILWKKKLAGSLTLTIIVRKAKFIVKCTNFKP